MVIFCCIGHLRILLIWFRYNRAHCEYFQCPNGKKWKITKWKPFLTVNYTKSVQYWVYKIGTILLDKKVASNTVTVLHNNYFYNQYYSNFVISNISLHNKYYRVVLLKFLNLTLLNWQSWSKNYNMSYKFMLISKHFYLVRYYNSYFFKMYNF
jgi:hypothetical protein